MNRTLTVEELETELVGFAEVHALYNNQRGREVHFTTVTEVMKREDFPKPVANLANGRIYLRSEIMDYLQTPRKPGPRPKSR